MTLEQFLEKLEQTPRDWKLWSGQKMIRRHSQCPISALNGWFACAYSSSAKVLGIDKELADQIANAADNEYETELRTKLLKACGLAEVGG